MVRGPGLEHAAPVRGVNLRKKAFWGDFSFGGCMLSGPNITNITETSSNSVRCHDLIGFFSDVSWWHVASNAQKQKFLKVRERTEHSEQYKKELCSKVPTEHRSAFLTERPPGTLAK